MTLKIDRFDPPGVHEVLVAWSVATRHEFLRFVFQLFLETKTFLDIQIHVPESRGNSMATRKISY